MWLVIAGACVLVLAVGNIRKARRTFAEITNLEEK